MRLEKDRILCYVNDQLVIESNDDGYTKGRAGLAKFRDTVAEFKHFQVAEEVPPRRRPPPSSRASARRSTAAPNSKPASEVVAAARQGRADRA